MADNQTESRKSSNSSLPIPPTNADVNVEYRGIRQLPSEVINQIAAGEVVERPSHLVKELLENSLDAGATEIEVEIDRSARSLRVRDNGHGIHRDDLGLALQRHATSKIETSDDLFRLVSFGFRGEALASAASVSQLTLASRLKKSAAAFQIQSIFGEIKDVCPHPITDGTEIHIQNLFENVPARLKFLKTPAHEINQVRQVVKAMAMANPTVMMKLKVGGELDLLLNSENQDLKDILGVRQLYWCEFENSEGYSCKIGFASPTEVAKTSKNIWIFVQGRWVQDRTIQAAVMDAYRSLLMHGEYPQCAVFVRLPADHVDVNIHPTKSQIKFVDSSKVYRVVHHALREGLSRSPWFQRVSNSAVTSSGGSIGPSTDPSSNGSTNNFKSEVEAHRDEVRPTTYRHQTMHAVQAPLFASEKTQLKTKDFELLKMIEDTPLNSPEITPKTTAEFNQKSFVRNGQGAEVSPENRPKYWSQMQVIGQLHLTYIVCQYNDELVLVDQHAAHERVAFERLMQAWKSGKSEQQNFLIPLILNFSPDRVESLLQNQDSIARMGFVIEQTGPNSIGVLSAPAFVKEKAIQAAFEKMSHELTELGSSFAVEKTLSDIFATMACHSVIRAGQSLSSEEMKALLSEMDEFAFSSFCPHGRPVSIKWGQVEIEKLFGRRNS